MTRVRISALLIGLSLAAVTGAPAQRVIGLNLPNTIEGTVSNADGYGSGRVCAVPGRAGDGLARQFEVTSGLNGRPSTDAAGVYAQATDFLLAQELACADVNVVSGHYMLTVPTAGPYSIVFAFGNGVGIPATFVLRGWFTFGVNAVHLNPAITPSLGTSNVVLPSRGDWMVSEMPTGRRFAVVEEGTGLMAGVRIEELIANRGVAVEEDDVQVPFSQIAKVTRGERSDSTWEVVIAFRALRPVGITDPRAPRASIAPPTRLAGNAVLEFADQQDATDARNYFLWHMQHGRE